MPACHVWASDIELRGAGQERCALTLTDAELPGVPIITNPPWTRAVLHPMIAHLSSLRPTWLLFDADWPHTRQASELMLRCERIVAIGRVKWIEGSPHTGKDNCAWYLFRNGAGGAARFYGRAP